MVVVLVEEAGPVVKIQGVSTAVVVVVVRVDIQEMEGMLVVHNLPGHTLTIIGLLKMVMVEEVEVVVECHIITKTITPMDRCPITWAMDVVGVVLSYMARVQMALVVLLI
jgi:hypothetical protein